MHVMAATLICILFPMLSIHTISFIGKKSSDDGQTFIIIVLPGALSHRVTFSAIHIFRMNNISSPII